MRMRIMKRPGVRLSRCTRPTHLSRVFMSAFSTASQSSSPERMAAANSYTLLNAVVASFASFAFSIGLPAAARSRASSGKKEEPVGPSHVGPAGPTFHGIPAGDCTDACTPARDVFLLLKGDFKPKSADGVPRASSIIHFAL